MKRLRVVEVGPRDGLQNEPRIKALSEEALCDVRVKLVTGLAESGLADVEVGAFVRADRIPQMARTDLVIKKIRESRPELWAKHRFWALVPNQKGLELALQAGAKHISVFTATSDAFNEKNVQMSVDESLAVLKPVVTEAKSAGLAVRGYVSTVWGCPYSGTVSPQRAKQVTEELLAMGVEEVSLGDTIGVATPKQVDTVLALLPKTWPLAVHFHDTRGTAIAFICLPAISRRGKVCTVFSYLEKVDSQNKFTQSRRSQRQRRVRELYFDSYQRAKAFSNISTNSFMAMSFFATFCGSFGLKASFSGSVQ